MALLASSYLLNLNSVCVCFIEVGNLIKCADELGQFIDFSENMISIITIAKEQFRDFRDRLIVPRRRLEKRSTIFN